MKLIVGLGNPGKEYEGTRHNAGFMVLDKLVCHREIAPAGECVSFELDKKFKAAIAQTQKDGEKLILVKPQTFMNLSGESVVKILSFWKLGISDLIVISDDIDLPLGHARIRTDGSSGGHKGLQDIIDKTGSDSFTRVRIGIQSVILGSNIAENQENNLETAEFVLSRFNDREIKIINEIVDDTISYIVPFLGGKSEIPAHSLEAKFDSL